MSYTEGQCQSVTNILRDKIFKSYGRKMITRIDDEINRIRYTIELDGTDSFELIFELYNGQLKIGIEKIKVNDFYRLKSIIDEISMRLICREDFIQESIEKHIQLLFKTNP